MIKEKWEKFGEENPYYAVLTLDKFDKGKLSDDAKNEFFKTGFEYIDRIWGEIKIHFDENFYPHSAVDFGCGVGRLAIPLAEKAGTVTGIDISEKMLEKARENSRRYGFDNTSFYQTDEFFSTNHETFDLIHSTIVFQHINPKEGLKIFENLIKVLNEGGIGVIHFAYKNPASKYKAFKFKLYRDYSIFLKLRNFLKRSDQPLFPMYEYDLNEVFHILQNNDCHRCFTGFSDHGIRGVIIYFQKKKESYY